jgi:hypothetical protein
MGVPRLGNPGHDPQPLAPTTHGRGAEVGEGAEVEGGADVAGGAEVGGSAEVGRAASSHEPAETRIAPNASAVTAATRNTVQSRLLASDGVEGVVVIRRSSHAGIDRRPRARTRTLRRPPC